MTTLTINIPDTELDVISSISTLVKKVGGDISIYSDDDLDESELAKLKSAYKEALDIKSGRSKGLPASELWND